MKYIVLNSLSYQSARKKLHFETGLISRLPEETGLYFITGWRRRLKNVGKVSFLATILEHSLDDLRKLSLAITLAPSFSFNVQKKRYIYAFSTL